MKYIISTVIFGFLLSTQAFSQSVEVLGFQGLFRDADNNLLSEQSIGLQFNVLQGSASGTLVYSETKLETANNLGIVSTTIGNGNVVIGDFSMIDWSNGPYFLTVEADPEGGSNYTLSTTSQMQAVATASQSSTTALAETIDYNNLSNLPDTITSEQITILDLMSISQTVNLDTLINEVNLNSDKVTFPGFGTTSGTAFNILWRQVDGNVYYPSGNVFVNQTATFSPLGTNLIVNGAIGFKEEPTDFSPGQLHYNRVGKGFLFYTNNLGETKSLGTGDISFNTLGATLIVNNDEGVSVRNHLIIGENVTTGYDFGEFDLVFASATNILYSNDTSNSASFPNKDWSLQFNDTVDGGDDFFALISSDNQVNPETPLKVDANAPTSSFYLNGSGELGLGSNAPSETLDVNGTITASAFVGDASQLTGLNGMASPSISNAGSTTIGADSNADTLGDIRFDIGVQNVMTVVNNGDVTIGNVPNTARLTVDGNISVENINTEALRVDGSLVSPIESRAIQSFSLDISDANIVLLEEPSDTFITNLQNGVTGRAVTIILQPTSANVTIFSGSIQTPNAQQIVLTPNSAITLLPTSNFQFQVIAVVN